VPPTATPTDTPTATPTDTPTATPTDTPTATPTTPALPKVSIGNQVWQDDDNNGVFDPAIEVPIPNLLMELWVDLDHDGVAEPQGDDAVQIPLTTTTTVSGTYSFTNLLPGGYFVRIPEPPRVIPLSSFPYAAPDDGVDNNDNGRQPDGPTAQVFSSVIQLVVGEEPGTDGGGNYDYTVDFGLVDPFIGNLVWYDQNNNGQVDVGEPGIPNVAVYLHRDANNNGVIDGSETTPLRTTTTDLDGLYVFGDIGPGIYQVVLPFSNFATGQPLVAYPNSSTPTNNQDDQIDEDDNGLQPSTALTVTSPLIALAVDGESTNGSSEFGRGNTLDDGDDNNGDMTIDFGFFGPLAQFGDRVWIESDNDGLAATAEIIPVAGMVITATSGANVYTTTTNSQGYYSFTVAGGTYSVTYGFVPASYGLVFASATPGGSTESGNAGLYAENDDPDRSHVNNTTVTVAAGQANWYIDFAFWQPLELGNRVWYDVDNSGTIDATERGVVGVTLTLLDGAGTPVLSTVTGLPFTTTTNSGGYYTFTGLISGTYQVRVDAGNFQAGQALATYLSSDPTESDPNVNGDSNDNGLTPATLASYLTDGVVSGLVSLRAGDEPTAEVDESSTGTVDTSSNLSVDFGFVRWDRGDLPDVSTATNSPAYRTTLADGGPSHVIIDGLHIGASEDSETDGQPSATANGDDANGLAVDDEDGVTLPAFMAGQAAVVTINVVNTTGENAWVYGFIDFNGDGDFDDAEETAWGVIGNSGVVSLTYQVPAGADTQQRLGARFRLGLAEAANLDQPTGPVASGEVEDYLIQMQTMLGAIGNYVWLDENADGMQDAGEPGLPNVIVTMVDNHGQPYTTTTDSQGGYLFPDLPQGIYTVTIPVSNFNPGGSLAGLAQTPLSGGDEDLGNKDDAGYAIDLAWGEENLTADFGYNPLPADDVNNGTGLAALGDRVWIDSDGDGTQDPNEVPVAGVALTLYSDPDGNGVYDTLLATDITDANGNYLFDELPAGAYVVAVTSSATASHDVLNPGVYTQTGDPDHFGLPGSNNDNLSTQPAVLAPGDLFLNVDFGYQPQPTTALNSVGDTVWFDADADGNGPSQPAVDGGAPVTQGAGGNADTIDYGIGGVTVTLVQDMNGNGVYDLGEPVIATDVTDANGQYLFAGLVDGRYLVWVNDSDNVLAGLKPTWDRDDGLVAPNDLSGVDLDSASVNPARVNNRAQDFGYVPQATNPERGLLGDTIWFDSNKDGVQNPGELGIEGVVVTLTDNDDNAMTPTTTDENGHYYFANLPLDELYKVVVAPENFAPGGVLEGMTNTGDKEGDKNNTTTSAVLTSQNPIDLTNDLGYAVSESLPVGRVGNLVWLDANADGVWAGVNGPDGVAGNDDDEPLIAGVTLDLYRDLNGNGQLDAGEPKLTSTTTTATPVTTSGDVGNYLFDHLPVIGNGDGDAAAEYVVDVTDVNGVLAGYWHSLGTPDVTNNSQRDADAVEISAEQPENLTADFGYYVEPAAVGNYIWVDTNGNGRQDDGETGLNSVQVKLTVGYANGTSVQVTTVTTSDGSGNPGWYSFGNLLIDEDHNGSGDDAEPVHTITVAVNQAALATYKPTLLDAPGDDKLDADNPAGVVAKPVQGQTDTHAQDPANTEPTIASYDFGFYRLASLGNYVWLDQDKDGVQDDSEPAVVGVKVDLLDKNSALITSTVTSLSGVYTFANLAPGVYSVKFTPPAGYQLTTPNAGDDSKDSDAEPATGVTQPVTLVSGEHNPTLDAGLHTRLTLGNLVWHDQNNNGQVDAGEAGFPGVTLQLFSAGADPATATPLATTTTDAEGHYLFNDLLPGQYFVYLSTPPLGYPISSTPTDNVDNGEDNDDNGGQDGLGQPASSPVVALQPNSEPDSDGDGKNGDLTVDFGFFAPASLGDLVWYDANRDGIQDNIETGAPGTTKAIGVPGVFVTISAADGTKVAAMTTDSHGYYRFENLLPGAYVVEFQPPAGYIVSPINMGTDDAFDSDADSATLLRTPVTTLVSGEHNPTLDLGLSLPTLPTAIGDRVWFDSDHDGVQDAGEPGIQGVTGMLYRADNTVVASTQTDSTGYYEFNSLPPGDYYIQFVPLAGYLPSPLDQGGDDTTDSDADGTTGKTLVVTLVAGQPNPTVDAGFYLEGPAASIGNYVWFDKNTDGIQDGDETGIPGLRVTLYSGMGTSIATVQTDAAGHYHFDNLPPGDYFIKFDNRNIYLPTTQSGGDDALDSDADPLMGRTPVTTLVAGENDNTWDAGFFLADIRGAAIEPAVLGDRAWQDTDNDGIQDADEQDVSDVVVKLYDGSGQLLATTSTAANGKYRFLNLAPRAYSVEFIQPFGYLLTLQNQGNDDALNSDADLSSGRTAPVSLLPGETNLNLDVGISLSPAGLEEGEEPTFNTHIFMPIVSNK